MANFSGMNFESILGQVVPGFSRQSEAVNHVIQEVERLIGTVQTEWKGNDSTQFIQKWQSEYRRPLQQLAQELQQLSELAKRNAERQRDTSASL